MSSSLFRAAVLGGASALFISCTPFAKAPPTIGSLPLLAPARNELYVSGEDRLTLDGYETLRTNFRDLRPDDLAMLALDSQWLLRNHGREDAPATLKEAARCIRALFLPPLSATEQKTSERLLRDSFAISSLSALESLLKPVRHSRRVEWNPELRKEYGLQAAP